MKTEITPEEYKNIYEVCDWNPKAFSVVLKKLGYSDELIVNGGLYFSNTPIKALVNVKEVNGHLILSTTSIESLGNLEIVRGSLHLQHTLLKDLGNLQTVTDTLWIRGSYIYDNFSLKEIRRKVSVEYIVYR